MFVGFFVKIMIVGYVVKVWYYVVCLLVVVFVVLWIFIIGDVKDVIVGIGWVFGSVVVIIDVVVVVSVLQWMVGENVVNFLWIVVNVVWCDDGFLVFVDERGGIVSFLFQFLYCCFDKGIVDVDKCVFIVKMYGGVIIVSFISIY